MVLTSIDSLRCSIVHSGALKIKLGFTQDFSSAQGEGSPRVLRELKIKALKQTGEDLGRLERIWVSQERI